MNQAHNSRLRISFLTAALILGAPLMASGQGSSLGLPTLTWKVDSTFGAQGQQLAYLDKSGTPIAPGKQFSEVLKGNGARGGYVLSHGGVIPSSVWISVGAHTLKANVDYNLDYANGMIGFAEPVRTFDSVRVSYQYVEGQDAARSPAGMSGMALNFNGTSLNLGYGISTGVGGLDFNTYGMAMNTKLGGTSSINGLLYFSSLAQSSNNVVERLAPGQGVATSRAQAVGAAGITPKNDSLIVQNLNLASGKASFRATYQDVGQNFGGFQALRVANAKAPDMLAQIDTLAKEQGIKRLGFGTGLQMSKSDKLSLDWDKISDGSGDVVKQALGYSSKTLNFHYATQDIGTNFAGFQKLREGDAAQWARERGLHRSDMTLGFTGSKAAAFGFSRSQVGDQTGSLTRDLFTYNSKSMNFLFSNRKGAAAFARLNDLTDADKVALALDIHRQYNPNATAADVTAVDKQQIAAEIGLNRDQMALAGGVGKQGQYAFSRSSLSDDTGSVARTMFNYGGKNLQFNYLDQTISSGFTRLAGLTAFEHAQLGNEVGLHRTSMGLTMGLTKASTFGFTHLAIGDSTSGMTRQAMTYAAKGLDIKFNMASTAKTFARAIDLAGTSDADKAAIEGERGFKRMDFTANLTSISGLALSTYTYSAHDAEDALGRDIYRHSLAFTPNRISHLNFLMDGHSNTASGVVQDGVSHDLLSYDTVLGKSMKFLAFHDDLTTTTTGVRTPTVMTDFLHFETDRTKPGNILAELKRVSFGNGHFENTTQFDWNLRPSKVFGFHFNRTAVDRGQDPSADTDSLQWNWQVGKTTSVSGNYGMSLTNNGADTTNRSITLGGLATKTLNVAATYAEGMVENTNYRRSADLTVSNAKPMNVLGLKDTTVSLKYAGVNDQGRQLTEQAAAKVQGMLGKNAVGFEYGGALAANATSAQTRSFSFKSDPNPKLPLHFDFMYKANNVNSGAVQLVRAYNLTYIMNKATNLTFKYSSLPETAPNVIQPLKSTALTLNHQVNKLMSFALNYTDAVNVQANTRVTKLGALLNGKTDKLSSVQVGYNVDITNLNGQNVNAHTVSLGYTHTVDADHSVGLSTSYTVNANGVDKNVLQTNVEFKSRF